MDICPEMSGNALAAEGKYKKKDDSYLFRIKGQDVVKGTVNDGKLVLETKKAFRHMREARLPVKTRANTESAM